MIKSKLKKSASVLLSLAIIISTLSIGFTAYGDALVAINSTNFPDNNFRAFVTDWYDDNGDGYLSYDEIGGVTLISVTGMLDSYGEDETISSLKGIEFFTSCRRLRCGGIGLTSLDVSAMPQLVELTCAGNELVSLDVSNNTNLQWLNCSSNMLQALDVSHNTALTRLECYVNSIESLNVSSNTALTTLRCQQNKLTRLNVSSNTALKVLNCSKNNLMCLDLSANTNIEEPTDAYYGNQVIEARALIDGGEIYVRVPVDDYLRIKSSSLDKTIIIDDVEYNHIGYNNNEFITNDIEEIKNGIDYSYDVGLEGAENMSIHINVVRDFYQVKFFTDETKTATVASMLVNKNRSATAPQITDMPQCKLFAGWVGDYTNVTEDREIYAQWNDDHNVAIVSLVDRTINVNCTKCGECAQAYYFPSIVNARAGSSNYVEIIDINNDGIINGKDYVHIYKDLK